MSKKRENETAAEKLGYRWMMRCLRALDTRPRDQRAMPGVVVTLDHLKIVVHHAAARRYKGGWKAFKKDFRAAAAEALSMMQAGSLAAGCAFVRPGQDEPDGATPFPESYKVVFTLRTF